MQISLSQKYRHLLIAHSSLARGASVLICQGRGSGDASETDEELCQSGRRMHFTLERVGTQKIANVFFTRNVLPIMTSSTDLSPRYNIFLPVIRYTYDRKILNQFLILYGQCTKDFSSQLNDRSLISWKFSIFSHLVINQCL